MERKAIYRSACLMFAVFLFLLPWWVDFHGLSEEGHRVFGIFMLAIVLWITEIIPLHATAALIIFLEILLISNKAILPLPEEATPAKYSVYYQALAHPVLMLFLGGFFLADGAAKYKLDKNLARILLRPFGSSPQLIMLGLMLITAMLSMFMSNTATTATMMAIVYPVMASFPKGDRMKIGLALSIPIAANVGGIATPVGTPPNAIALGALSDAGISISFVKWMGMALPFTFIILMFAWQMLIRFFSTKQQTVTIQIDTQFDTSKNAVIFYSTAALTILLWLTEPLHHIKSTIVGFLPVVVLLSTRVFSTREMQSIQWHVLWLVAGGIALGVGVSHSGLDQWIIGKVHWDLLPAALLAGALCLLALSMSTIISNSASANLLIPIGMSLASSGTVTMNPVMTGFFIAIGASLAMALPISTPPNAIAYSTGLIPTKYMAITGLVVGIFGLLIFVFIAPLVWKIFGLI